jgi:two-component sensor histidine kinase/CheY-like chemotaxis protein
MAANLRVLILEDRQSDADIMLYELRRSGFDPDWRCVDRAGDFLSHLDWPPDLILADYALPEFDALRALHLLQERGRDIPFIVVTGSLSEEVAVECMKQGAMDYLLKDRLTRLGPAVQRALEQKEIREERRRKDSRILASLREKEVLLKEIQHRVKNNLQVVASLLQLQSGQTRDPEARQMLKEGQSRIRAMALVHQKLYQSPNLAKIKFAQYVEELTNSLLQSFGIGPEVISLKITINEVFLGIDTAIPVALIIHELVSNSLRHAFPDGRRGRIEIDLHHEEGEFSLTVSDDGIGLPASVRFPETDSLGWQLVSALADQLEARVELRNHHGTFFQFTFPELKYRERS